MIKVSYFSAPGVNGSFIDNMTREKISRIEQLVCNQTGETLNRIKTRLRTRNRVLTRYMIFHFLRRFTKLSLTEISGLYGGGQDHSTVCHGIKVLKNLTDTEPALKKQVEWIDNVLKEDLIRLQ